MEWKAYNALAWTEEIIVGLDEYKDEVKMYVDLIKQHLNKEKPSMLHLGCGAGGHDYYFKNYYSITGIDLSEGMLTIAKKRNPEIHYFQGDMRTFQLDQLFDIVIIPDAIMYMTTLQDLEMTLNNAIAHLKTNGLLLIVTLLEEDYENNNFVYTGQKDNQHLTIFENNHRMSKHSYEATMIYLIRQNNQLTIETDVHYLGIFSTNQWINLFNQLQLNHQTFLLNQLYDPYLLGDDANYKLKIFILKKSL